MSTTFLMKARTVDRSKPMPGNWLWCIKFDGMRAWWDGGKFNQNNPLHPKATGLWSINGNPIFAPEWWLKKLPPYALDGELWAGPGGFHHVMSVCRSHGKDQEWKNIRYMVYDSPQFDEMFGHRIAKTTTGEVRVDQNLRNHYADYRGLGFSSLRTLMDQDHLTIAKQTPFTTDDWTRMDEEVFPNLLEQGHEGVVFRKLGGLWEPTRSKGLLKYKPYSDAEGTVLGYIGGNKTEKGGTWYGMLGSVIVSWIDPSGAEKIFAVGGFNAGERVLKGDDIRKYSGLEVPEHVYSETFPRGSKITFRYRTVTDTGVPREAQFHRAFVDDLGEG